MPSYSLIAVVHREDDQYVALCPEVGTVSQGATIEEAVANLKEATELYLDEEPDVLHNRSFITVTTFTVEPTTDAKQPMQTSCLSCFRCRRNARYAPSNDWDSFRSVSAAAKW